MKLFDTIPVGISITLDKTCRKIKYNKKAAEFLRIQPWKVFLDSGLNNSPLKMYHEGKELSPEEIPVQRAVWKGETVKNLEIDFVWEDGTRKTAIWNSNPLLDGEGVIIGAISAFDDITGRKRIENELRIVNNNLAASQEIAHSGSFSWDLENNRMVWSDEFYRILGLTPGQIQPSFDAFINMIHLEDREKAARDILRFASKGKKARDEFRIVRSDDAVKFIEVIGKAARGGEKPALIIGMVRDITRHKHAEEMLMETRDYLENLIGYANAPIIVWDTSFKITIFSHAFERLTGYTEGEVLGLPLEILFPENSKRESLNHIRQTSSGERWEAVEIPILGADGSIHIVLWNSANVYNRDKTGIIATIAQGQDITLRKEVEEAVYANRTLLFNIIDGTSDLVGVKNLEGRMVLANRALAKITDKPFNEIIGYDISEYFGYEAGQLNRENDLEVTTSGKSGIFEETIPAKDGDRIFLANKFPYRNKSGEIIGVIGILRDITERKKAEVALKESEERYRSLAKKLQEVDLRQSEERFCKAFYSSPAMMYIQNLDGRFIEINDKFTEVTGYSRDEIIGRNSLELNAYIDPAQRVEAFQRINGSGRLQNFEIKVRAKNGKILSLVTSAEIVQLNDERVILYHQFDITERKQMEEKLRQSEERFFKAFNSSPVMMNIRTLNGNCVDINNTSMANLGYSKEELIDTTYEEHHVYGSSGPPPELIKSMDEKKPINNLEVKFYTKQGKQRTGLLSTEFIELNGEMCILIITNDITELRQFEKEMSRLDRLKLVGEMAGGIAHEIRNPMMVVRGYLEYIGNKKEFEKYADRFELMISELDRANSIITEYLTLARSRAYDAEPENLNVLINDLIYLIETDAIKEDKYINMELEEVPDMLLEKNDIKQMILNLIRNGLEAMAPGGYLTVRTFVEGKEVVLAVSDQGKGIPPEHLDKMGIPFFTTKDYGTGLGLAMCYKIATRHNAKISIETSPEGTTFFVKFDISGAPVS